MDPVSVAKARPLARMLSPQRPLLALTPNLDELSAILGETVPQNRAAIARAARRLHDVGVRNVWVRRGVRGQPAQQPRRHRPRDRGHAARPAGHGRSTSPGPATR